MPEEIARIKKQTVKLLPASELQEKVSNEIIFAIRFGALTTNQQGDKLSIAHAVSIAIKLVREKRWDTPAPLLLKEKTQIDYGKRTGQYFENNLPSILTPLLQNPSNQQRASY